MKRKAHATAAAPLSSTVRPMSDVVLIHGDEWKVADIAEDVEWCRTLQWAPSRYTNATDHSHCSICSWTLAVSDDPDIGEGLLSGRQRWLCKECHAKFVATPTFGVKNG
jgi:hypothetical protein